MYKSFIYIVLLGIFSGAVSAQAPIFEWVRPITGEQPPTNPEIRITDMATDAIGDTYVTGIFRSVIDFGSGVLLQGDTLNSSLFLVKYDTYGTPLWARRGGAVNNGSWAFEALFPQIAVDGAFSVYWSGSYRSDALVFEDSIVISHTCNACSEGYLLKLNSAGDFVFGKSLRAAVDEDLHITDVKVDFYGRYYITGDFTGTELWLEDGVPVENLPTEGYFLAAYDPTGDINWAAFQSNPGGKPGYTAIALSPDGERVVVAGRYMGSGLDFGNNVAVASTANSKAFAVWYDAAGTPLTAGALEAPSFVDFLDVELDTQYRLWAVCNFWPNLAWNGQIFASASTEPIIIGSLLAVLAPWLPPANIVSITDTPESSLPLTSVELGQGNRFYTSGISSQNIQPVPGAEDVITQGCSDLILTGGTGDTLQWARSVGGDGCETALISFPGTIMTIDALQNLYLTGHIYNDGNFDGIELGGITHWIGKMSATQTLVQEAGALSTVRMSPNPAGTTVQVVFPDVSEGRCRVFTATGMVLTELSVLTPSIALNVSGWPAGVYFLEFTDKQGKRALEKLLVQH
ncbi:MAG TPA: T9SS type A sorting domain-containing protein [Saprospiraceae bacterium]|nr:T9SS type A sorting domain-containing protein [Saprospiraceae bacterium]HPI06875.1 T9SS type A sorting domain-containing protein [Saprospiraceae bacterium]